MINLKRETEENLRQLSSNPYPGRGIVLGRTLEGKLVQIYWIMGRSENSRNRQFVWEYGDLRTEPVDPAKVEDPSLVIYRAMTEYEGHFLVSNGDHTDTLLEVVKGGEDYQDAMRMRSHEPDEPHFTPRIAGSIFCKEGEATRGWLGIIKACRFNPERSFRHSFEFDEISPGFGWMITTYRGDGTPLPTFAGEPINIPLPDEGEKLLEWIWLRLNESNRISIAMKEIDEATGKSTLKVINKYKA